ncbi:MAG: hydroxyacid dehydrogenase [Synergistaceae bacterium]|nr:hydroxyacid dehydrogenase [Synergistaceae bacterium]
MIGSYPKHDNSAEDSLKNILSEWEEKIVVLDDDPTGVQTVHDVPVYTSWTQGDINDAFAEKNKMFFILTNSRGLSIAQAERINKDIARHVLTASSMTGNDFVFISRSDSTLRGYYPLETEVLRSTLEESGICIDGEIICPFFMEGGRYTFDDVHYLLTENGLVPVAETEYALDRFFGYKNSNLAMWIEEKTGGKYKRNDILSISIDILRRGGAGAVCDILMTAKNFSKIIVNSLCYDDIRTFCIGYIKANKKGKKFIFRSAASLPKILGGIDDKPLLNGEEICNGSTLGGIVVVGSHVANTTAQLEELRALDNVEFIEFNHHLVFDELAFSLEVKRIKKKMHECILQRIDTVVYTRRERIDVNTGNPQDEWNLTKKISDSLTSFVKDISVQPSYIVAKGGITSSEIGTEGLSSKRAVVIGQIFPGVPVWKLGSESKFPNMPYVIFPGNVGDKNTLKKVVEKLRNSRSSALCDE